jgi:type IV pilus biogenesis protein CpaD/CtpE
MRYLGLACSTLLLAGCAGSDPYQNPGAWYPVGANAANIARMAASPHDLVLGRSEHQVDAQAAASDIQRLWQGEPRPLLDTSATKAGPD